MKKRFLLLASLLLASSQFVADACTSLLVGKDATVDGSTMITYNADAYVLYGELYQSPAADYPKGAMLDVYEWDTRKYLGKIPQVRHTYATIGNMNEHQLAITESTWGGRTELMDTTAIMDYGSLIYITLQRAKTAREAIKVMTDLVEKYGYYSTGESFSIADPNEVWVMEMISKGMEEKGAVWVAIRIPDDCISGHANQARIHRIPFNDKENCMYSKDVVSFARKMGYFNGKDEDFSFSKAYSVTDYLALRGCDGRVWSFFNRYAEGMDKYLPYIKAEGGEVMPLYVKPKQKLSVRDVQGMLRDHFEGTDLDMTKDPGAGPWNSPYRFAPLMYKVDSVEYAHERPIATQQTGFTLVAQMRNWLPDAVGGILWFGVDDSAMTVYNPIYCCTTKVSECYRVGNGDYNTFSWTSAFWINNWVANQTYIRYSQMYPDVQRVQNELESSYTQSTKDIEKKALEVYKQSPAKAVEMLTQFSDSVSENATARYKQLGEYLLVKFMDGRVKKVDENGNFTRTETGYPTSPTATGYSEDFYRNIVKSEGDRLKVKEVDIDAIKH